MSCVTGDLTSMSISLHPALPFTLGLYALLQVAIPAAPVDISLARPVIETGVLGALLWMTSRNQEQRWQATLKASEDRHIAREKENSERYAALLKQMEKTMAEDIETRGRVLAEIDNLKKSKYCIYSPQQAADLAKEIVRFHDQMDERKAR
jgi:hypothetical protein